MRPTSIQDILHMVEQPSRYLGFEVNRVQKDPEHAKMKFLIAFPDLYEIGTSHFGMQILYHLINRDPDMLAERVFAPAMDMQSYMQAHGIPLLSLESGIPAGRFDIVGFSLLYEMNYTNVLGMLSLAGIPFQSAQRRADDPLVIAGGPCTSNPEPVAEFFDAMVIGDGEVVVPQLTRSWLLWKREGDGRKESLLREWARLEGVYIPGFYKPVYDSEGFQTLRMTTEARGFAPENIRRAIVSDLKMEDFPDRPIVPFGRPIHDRLRLEVARGCTRGCRFCQAGMIYRPVRERSVAQLLSLAETSLDATGYEDMSLLSLSAGDYSGIVPLMQALMGRCEMDRIAVSLPSLRAGTLSPKLMGLIKKVRKTGFTMAIEAGSQRLRNIINKNIQQEDIFTMVADAFRLGWQVIKLYFMVGLPGETPQDLEEIEVLVREILKIKAPKGRRGKINISVNTFIPKAHTPFQWAGQLSIDGSWQKIESLRSVLRHPRVQLRWQNPENSFLEGLWARGDRRLSKLLWRAYQKGCRFDGWSDQFNFEKWSEAIKEVGLDADFFVTRNRGLEEPLPWDSIDVLVEKNFLKKEWQKAMTEALTPDCRDNPCTHCGVCDHETIRPRIKMEEAQPAENPESDANPGNTFFKTFSVSYKKLGSARFFGHLELVNIFLRAIRRARIPVLYSQGFHPKPKISFDDPLPLGYESLEETFRMEVPGNFRPDLVTKKMNEELPEGLRITGCQIQTRQLKGQRSRTDSYEVRIGGTRFDQKQIDRFQKAESVLFKRINRKGKELIFDLKKAVRLLKATSPDKLVMVISMDGGKTVRPAYILTTVFQLTDDDIKAARILKTGTVYG